MYAATHSSHREHTSDPRMANTVDLRRMPGGSLHTGEPSDASGRPGLTMLEPTHAKIGRLVEYESGVVVEPLPKVRSSIPFARPKVDEHFAISRNGLRSQEFIPSAGTDVARSPMGGGDWGGPSRNASTEYVRLCASGELKGDSKCTASDQSSARNPHRPQVTCFRTGVTHLEGIGTPNTLWRRSSLTLEKLAETAFSDVRPTSQLKSRRETESLSVLLDIALNKVPEAEMLTSIARGYHFMTSQAAAGNDENRRPSVQRASAHHSQSSQTQELCIRAVAMLRSCDYPLDDILCLFAVAASQLETVFTKLQVSDGLEKIYIALLQVSKIQS